MPERPLRSAAACFAGFSLAQCTHCTHTSMASLPSGRTVDACGCHSLAQPEDANYDGTA